MTEPAVAAPVEQHHGRCHGLTDHLLPTRDGCSKKAKPVCAPMGCPAKEVDGKLEEHMFGCGADVSAKPTGCGTGVVWGGKQQCCCCTMIAFFVYFVLFGIIQWIMFHWATENCGSLPDDYNFPGGGHGDHNGGPADNLMPRNALIVGRAPSIYGEAFDVFNSTDEGQMVSAPVGTWFRTWGPWFYTYTYQDTLNSKGTVYMRPTILGMFHVFSELKVMRCDGKGDVLKFTEGTAVLGNHVRAFLQTNTGRVMKMLVGGNQVAVVEETFHGQKSATFRSVDEKTKETIGSCILRGVNGQGFNEWFLHNSRSGPLPFYMTMSVAANYAFKIKNDKKAGKVPSLFAEMPQVLQATKDTIAAAKQSLTVAAGFHADEPPAVDAQAVKV